MAATFRAEATARVRDPRRTRTLALCFVAQNCGMGLCFGSFGPLLASTEQQFGVSRTLASTGMSLVLLAIGGLSPVFGALLQRRSIRDAMIVGALVSAFGYWGLALLHSFVPALLMYGLIGTGVCLTAILGPLVLISRWFETNRGRALSLVNLPIMLFVTPYVVARLLPDYGRFAILGTIGSIFLLLAPLLLLLVDHPTRPDKAGSAAVLRTAAANDTATILKQPAFWLLSFGIGIMAGAGVAYVVHIVPFGRESHMSLPAASALLSIYSGAGICGTLVFGWIVDRLGPPTALLLSAACQALLWWSLLQVTGGALYLVSALLGVCLVPLTTLHGSALSKLFGPRLVARATGYSYLIKLPFIFFVAPTIGGLFERFGGYRTPFLIVSLAMVISAASFYLMRLSVRNLPLVASR
jgi:MFS family permease